MSLAFCISLSPSETIQSLAEPLMKAGFVSAGDAKGIAEAAEVLQFCSKHNPAASWFLATKSGKLDLDLSYELSAAIRAELGQLLADVVRNESIKQLEIVMYDFGTAEVDECSGLYIEKIDTELTERYPFGGPPCTTILRFARS